MKPHSKVEIKSRGSGSSRAREFHPHPLTEPCGKVSPHTALHTQLFVPYSSSTSPVSSFYSIYLLTVGMVTRIRGQVMILVFLVNVQYSGKGSNSSREQVVNLFHLLMTRHIPFPLIKYRCVRYLTPGPLPNIYNQILIRKTLFN